MIPPFADVAVVGAGPSGAWAAYTLARQGARVVVFDGSHPREKPCGGGVTGRALALVAEAIGPASLAATPINRARFIDAATGRSVSVELDSRGIHPASALVVSSRTDFDGALVAAAERAGATLVTRRVQNVTADKAGIRVETADGACVARFALGADGANSLVRRRLARPFPRESLSIATGYFAHGVTSDEIVIEFVPDPPGYIWSFPRPTHLAIGVCAQADAGIGAATLRANTAAWIARTALAPGARLEPYSWPIPSLEVRHLQTLELAGPNWCLVGDAAGLVDPITREGIYFSLLSGSWAADALLAGRPSQYAARVREEILTELTRAARLKAGFFQPAFTQLFVRALQHSPAVAAVTADLIAGRQPYADLKWRLLKTMEWRLAWEALAGYNVRVS
jgi:geranylgeranyl reductase family protein